MITTFYGSVKSKNNAPQLLSACAFETAYGLSRKTLVLQFYSKYPVEELLIGKRSVIQKSTSRIMDDDTGIDPLIRKAKSGGLTEEHFTIYTKQILSSQKNGFDVAGVPKLADFHKEVIENETAIREVLETAVKTYDSILILADGKNESLITLLHEISDKTVICVEQGIPQAVYCADEKTIFAVTDYDTRSTYNLKYMRKAYDTKRITAVPYCVEFRDAWMSNNILQFLYENNSKTDEQTGNFVKSVKKLTALINEAGKDEEMQICEWDFKTIPEAESMPGQTPLTIMPQQIVVEEKKKHFWSRKKEHISIIPDADHTGGDDYIPEVSGEETEGTEKRKVTARKKKQAVSASKDASLEKTHKETEPDEKREEPVPKKTVRRVAVKKASDNVSEVPVNKTETVKKSTKATTTKKETEKKTAVKKETAKSSPASKSTVKAEVSKTSATKKTTGTKAASTAKKPTARAATVKTGTSAATKTAAKKSVTAKKGSGKE